jgi:hypothetical protein
MTVPRELAEFLTGTAVSDLPSQAVKHAAMLIASGRALSPVRADRVLVAMSS